MKKVLISGYHGFGNCGDEAILAAIVNNFKKAEPDIEIVALSRTPLDTQEKWESNRLIVLMFLVLSMKYYPAT